MIDAHLKDIFRAIKLNNQKEHKMKPHSVKGIAEKHGFSKVYLMNFIKSIGMELDSLQGSTIKYISPEQLVKIEKALENRMHSKAVK